MSVANIAMYRAMANDDDVREGREWYANIVSEIVELASETITSPFFL